MEPVRDELLPVLLALRKQAQEEAQPDQVAFFERIRAGLDNARDFDDLAGPFMELSTSAFHGFEFSLPVTLLLDRALELAQTLSQTLSATTEQEH